QVDGPPGGPDPNVPEQDFGHVDNPGIAKLLKERGYCANQEGKLYVAGGKGLGFDGMDVTTSVGRVRCSRCGITDPSDPRLPSCQEPPKCGEEEEPTPSYSQTGNIDLFLDTMVVQGPAGPRQPQPFFLWYAPHVPHIPVSPSRLVESRPHVIPASAAPDWLFGAGPDLLPRFPFAAPLYQPLFEENDMLGLYGNVWLADNGLARLRTMLVQRTVTSGNSCVSGWCSNAPSLACSPDGHECNSMAANTAIIFLSDNGQFLPFTNFELSENGYRTVLAVFDPRAPRTNTPRVDREIGHSRDVLPTLLDYAGQRDTNLVAAFDPHHTEEALTGVSLRPYLGASPPAAPLRNALSGPSEDPAERYARTRPGIVGGCEPNPAATSCVSTCANGPCAWHDTPGCPTTVTATAKKEGAPCLQPADCESGNCAYLDTGAKWCRYGKRCRTSGLPCDVPAARCAAGGQPCTRRSDCAAGDTCLQIGACPAGDTCLFDEGPPTLCSTDADCRPPKNSRCTSSNPEACTCEYPALKLYVTQQGTRNELVDLFTDPHD